VLLELVVDLVVDGAGVVDVVVVDELVTCP
jgi:hypothetical protein